MPHWLPRRITAIWLLLVAATLFSWIAGNSVGEIGARTAAIAGLVVAFVKARFVALDFMEVRNAPWLLRLFVEVWAVLVCAILIVLVA